MAEKIVFITGASKGIGFETARLLLKAGWKVALAARGEKTLTAAVESLNSENAMGVTCDVGDYASVKNAVNQIKQRFGTINALVNNAGLIDPIGKLHDLDPTEWMQLQQVNIGGVMNASHAVLPDMLANKSGIIINLSSGAAKNPVDGWSAYCTSKAAVNMFTRCLDAEYANMGIRVHDFIPGIVGTDMLNGAQTKFDNVVARLDEDMKLAPDIPAQCIAWLVDEGEGRTSGVEQTIRDPELRAMVGLKEREAW
ncbi:MAG: SDR family oxidoreductase [Rhizobiales bacterium]|nr:SDR family oxidoreductase [Hyphomicrobiales bacterium]NRB15445.1 SDR family oxidoreductase [Hyphomicrobiales bacterium]